MSLLSLIRCDQTKLNDPVAIAPGSDTKMGRACLLLVPYSVTSMIFRNQPLRIEIPVTLIFLECGDCSPLSFEASLTIGLHTNLSRAGRHADHLADHERHRAGLANHRESHAGPQKSHGCLL